MMKKEIRETVLKLENVDRELFVKAVQYLKARNCNMVEKSFEDLQNLSDLELEEVLALVSILLQKSQNGEIVDKEQRKEILNRTLIRTLYL